MYIRPCSIFVFAIHGFVVVSYIVVVVVVVFVVAVVFVVFSLLLPAPFKCFCRQTAKREN